MPRDAFANPVVLWNRRIGSLEEAAKSRRRLIREIDRLKVKARRAKLLGLDAPSRSATEVSFKDSLEAWIREFHGGSDRPSD
jgi:hypothetical protein